MSVCEQCGKAFTCAMRDGKDKKDDSACWCTALPKLAVEDMPASTTASRNCRCPECLRAWIRSRQA